LRADARLRSGRFDGKGRIRSRTRWGAQHSLSQIAQVSSSLKRDCLIVRLLPNRLSSSSIAMTHPVRHRETVRKIYPAVIQKRGAPHSM
jgi:hypothetical protein